MIPFKNRFHGHSSLNYVYKNGQAVRSRLITIKSIKNKNRKDSRFAVVVSKKVLKSAVKRNLVRRRIYEYVRIKLPQLKNIYDVVIIISSSEILAMSHKDMSDQFDQLFSQIDV